MRISKFMVGALTIAIGLWAAGELAPGKGNPQLEDLFEYTQNFFKKSYCQMLGF